MAFTSPAVPPPLLAPAATSPVVPPPLLAPTERDVFMFRIFRGVVGFVVLGLTAVFTLFSLGPLFVEGRLRTEEQKPSVPSPPFTLWSEHDSQALSMIMIISSTQAALLLSCWLAFRWRQRHSDDLGHRPSAAATKATPRRKQRKSKRADTVQSKERSERKRDRCREPLLKDGTREEVREVREDACIASDGPQAAHQVPLSATRAECEPQART